MQHLEKSPTSPFTIATSKLVWTDVQSGHCSKLNANYITLGSIILGALVDFRASADPANHVGAAAIVI